MNPKLYGFWPATLVSYDAAKRTGEVYIEGITDGADRGLTAEFAYPVGESDKDTELQISVPAPVDVYFEMGDPRCPVVFAFRTHQDGSAVVGTRRIRQENIELIANANLTLFADQAHMQFSKMTLVVPDGLTIEGPVYCQRIEASDDVIAGGVSTKTHPHLMPIPYPPTLSPIPMENP
jgi:hypothetical protein